MAVFGCSRSITFEVDTTIMGSMIYASLTEIPGRIAESNRRPFAPKEEFTRFIGIVAGVLLLATQLATAETTSDEDLITLAHKKFTGISDKERKAFDTFFEKTQKGERADLTPDLKHEKDPQIVKILTDPVYADVWEEDRVIQAEWLNWLCTDPKASAKFVPFFAYCIPSSA
jgi:hypothetical protein